MRLRFCAGMSERAFDRRADQLCVFPQGAGLVIVLARCPVLAALGQHGFIDEKVDRSRFGVDRNPVAIFD